MSDIAIKVEGLGKRFRLAIVPNLTVEEAIERRMRWLRGKMNHVAVDLKAGRWPRPSRFAPPRGEDFWAIKDVSFQVKHGEVLGIIGPNGAGKSTLLKILAQVQAPTEGRAELHGRVGALLEVGTGFNPELSGRENIFLYGSILGMDRASIARRFDEIVSFAENERFLDQPLKYYSSGMHSRLAFSVAAHLDCEILLVDEVLAVGDAAFRAKSMGKMQDVTGQGRAVIFVSHNMSAVNNMCHRGIVLKGGAIQFEGNAKDATSFYMEGVKSTYGRSYENPVRFARDEAKPIQLLSVGVCNAGGETSGLFFRDEDIIVEYGVLIREVSSAYYASLTIRDEKGNILIHSTDEDEAPSPLGNAGPGEHSFRIKIPRKLFRSGHYFLTPGLEKHRDGRVDKHENLLTFIVDDVSSHNAMRGVRHRQNLIFPDVSWRLESEIGAALSKTEIG